MRDLAAFRALRRAAEQRKDLRIGILASLVANLFSEAKTEPQDFVLRDDSDSEDRTEQNRNVVEAKARTLAALFGLKIEHGKQEDPG